MSLKKIMVLCTGNSCRSQMAEGFLRELSGGKVEAHSAGIISSQVNPNAISVMAEVGIDISCHTSDKIDPEFLSTMDVVITVCDNAAESCPVTPPEVKKLHRPIVDPVNFKGTKDETMEDFRRARDEIKEMVSRILDGELN